MLQEKLEALTRSCPETMSRVGKAYLALLQEADVPEQAEPCLVVLRTLDLRALTDILAEDKRELLLLGTGDRRMFSRLIALFKLFPGSRALVIRPLGGKWKVDSLEGPRRV